MVSPEPRRNWVWCPRNPEPNPQLGMVSPEPGTWVWCPRNPGTRNQVGVPGTHIAPSDTQQTRHKDINRPESIAVSGKLSLSEHRHCTRVHVSSRGLLAR